MVARLEIRLRPIEEVKVIHRLLASMHRSPRYSSGTRAVRCRLHGHRPIETIKILDGIFRIVHLLKSDSVMMLLRHGLHAFHHLLIVANLPTLTDLLDHDLLRNMIIIGGALADELQGAPWLS